MSQARKETADRASAIALADGSISDHNTVRGSSSIVASETKFIGCAYSNYPQVTGTVSIT